MLYVSLIGLLVLLLRFYLLSFNTLSLLSSRLFITCMFPDAVSFRMYVNRRDHGVNASVEKLPPDHAFSYSPTYLQICFVCMSCSVTV